MSHRPLFLRDVCSIGTLTDGRNQLCDEPCD